MTSILQYLLGAGIAGVLFTQIATTWRAWLARHRERVALMKLVHMEIMHNELILEQIRGASESIFESGRIAALHDDAWRENRARITQLESERAVEYLGMYYTSVATLISENRLYQELEDYSSDIDGEELFEGLDNNLGPLARYACERQTREVRVWSNGMVVVAGKWRPEKSVESTWYRRRLPAPAPDDEVDADS